METSLHRQLKEYYRGDAGECEVRVRRYRIDVVTEGCLVEIQHASLSSIQSKVLDLLEEHRVMVVKPIVARKQIVKLRRRGGKVTSERLSPKRGVLLDLFDDLVHFTKALAHPRLVLEVPLVEIREHRYPGHGRRRRRRSGDFQVEDQHLLRIAAVHRFNSVFALRDEFVGNLKRPFHTGQLAAHLGVERWVAQRVAYSLREAGAVTVVGKQRNALLYADARRSGKRRAAYPSALRQDVRHVLKRTSWMV